MLCDHLEGWDKEGVGGREMQDGNKDTDLLENGLEDMGRGRGEL